MILIKLLIQNLSILLIQTGASTGIGRALALEMVKRGAKVALSARREIELHQVAAECNKICANSAVVVVFDQLKYNQFGKTLNEVCTALGGRIDIVVINAGRSQRGLAEETELAVTRELTELNVFSYVALTLAVLPIFFKQHEGQFVITSSVSGKVGTGLSSSYCLTKHALQGYYNALRSEVADRNVAVTIINPGPVQSEIISSAFGKSLKEGSIRSAGRLTNVNDADPTKMTAERHAQLMAKAIATKQAEAWISHNPVLLLTYMAQYVPAMFPMINNAISRFRIELYKHGIETFDIKVAREQLARIKAEQRKSK